MVWCNLANDDSTFNQMKYLLDRLRFWTICFIGGIFTDFNVIVFLRYWIILIWSLKYSDEYHINHPKLDCQQKKRWNILTAWNHLIFWTSEMMICQWINYVACHLTFFYTFFNFLFQIFLYISSFWRYNMFNDASGLVLTTIETSNVYKVYSIMIYV